MVYRLDLTYIVFGKMEMRIFHIGDEVGFIGGLEVWYICVFVTEYLDSLVIEHLDNYIGYRTS